jgi:alkane 1-monooxygenase
MVTATLPAPVRPKGGLRLWALHLVSLALPLGVLLFVATGPHPWWAALPSLLAIPAVMLFDYLGGASREEPPDPLAGWPFDAILVALALIQTANIILAMRMMAHESLSSIDAFVAAILVGANTGYSAIVVAHELVHRTGRGLNLLGRWLLVTTCYEHFSTEHVRGHHVRVGTDEDPATARYRESFRRFWRRTIPAQFRSAWRLEARRLGDEDMRWNDWRMLRSRVVHGVIAEALLTLAILAIAGPAAVVVFLAQAFVAVGLLEAVNYFEHYGLRRTTRKIQPADSWDTDARFTRYALVGLSRHADHHAHASRPYQSLRHSDESARLPYGYIVTTLSVIFANRRIRAALDAELQRRKLGPFAPA